MVKAKSLFLGAILFLSFSGIAQAGTPQETLSQYISDLQKNPDDNALREKIIKLAQEMKPVPKVPNEVDELVGKATYAVKNAKSEADFSDAVDAYQKVLLIAPWVPEYYYNLGAVQEKAGKFKEAVVSLELYLLAVPDAKDAKEVREHIGGLKYAARKATKESSPEAVVAQEQNKSDDWLKKIDGRRYRWTAPNGNDGVIDVKGKILVEGGFDADGGYQETGRFEITGREFTVLFPAEFQRKFGRVDHTFIISEDGYKIAERTRFSDGDSREYIYLWQR